MAEWERCEANDPNRCQASSSTHGQCPFKAVANQNYCPRHMAITESIAAKKAANQYRLQVYQERVTDFATNSELKNLRGEIGILRMVLEETIVITGGDRNKLLCYSGRISDMVTRISGLIKVCHYLDTKMGMMLDRDKVMLIGQAIVELVAEVVPDQSVLDTLGEKLVNKILEIAEQ